MGKTRFRTVTDECGFARRCGRDGRWVVLASPAGSGCWRMESRAGRGRAEMTFVALSGAPALPSSASK